METWTAQQIGQSGGAYSGRKVKFEDSGRVIQGILNRSDLSRETPRTFLAVDGVLHLVANSTTVTVMN